MKRSRGSPLFATFFSFFVLLAVPALLRAQITPPPSKGNGATPGGPAGGVLSGTYPNPGSTTLAPLASPALTGTPTAPTAAQNANSTQLATTAYTDLAVANAVAGVNPAVAVSAATVAASDTSGLTYNNGVSGVGATFTGTANTALTIDGFTFSALGQRLLVKNDTQSPSGAFNGIYYVTQLQTSLLAPILTRALDYDTPAEMNNTGAIPVISGTVNATTSWLMTANIVTVGTTPLTFAQFSYAPASIGVVKLAQQTLAGAVSSVTFSAIPGNFTNLILEVCARGSAGSTGVGVAIQFNADTTSGHYCWNQLYMLNASNTFANGGNTSAPSIAIGNFPTGTDNTNSAGTASVKMINYAGTVFNKSAISTNWSITGAVASRTGNILVMGEWLSTAAITSITVSIGSGNFVIGSQFTLYGEQ